jgi:hypothetical protein
MYKSKHNGKNQTSKDWFLNFSNIGKYDI